MALDPEERPPLHEADGNGNEKEGEVLREDRRAFLDPSLAHQADGQEGKQQQHPQHVAGERQMKPRDPPLPGAKDQEEESHLRQKPTQRARPRHEQQSCHEDRARLGRLPEGTPVNSRITD